MDQQLFDFAGLKPDGKTNPQGDTAFDPESAEPSVITITRASGSRPLNH
jgi:hypothetical protein